MVRRSRLLLSPLPPLPHSLQNAGGRVDRDSDHRYPLREHPASRARSARPVIKEGYTMAPIRFFRDSLTLDSTLLTRLEQAGLTPASGDTLVLGAVHCIL